MHSCWRLLTNVPDRRWTNMTASCGTQAECQSANFEHDRENGYVAGACRTRILSCEREPRSIFSSLRMAGTPLSPVSSCLHPGRPLLWRWPAGDRADYNKEECAHAPDGSAPFSNQVDFLFSES